MYFKEATLFDFRNYKEEKAEFHPKVNIITGNNAQGKTNLLEALYMMSLGKSFRTARDGDMIRFGSSAARISTISFKGEMKTELEIVLEEGKKTIRIDGAKILKNADMLENVYVVVFSPEDLGIVKDEPEKRRKFINRELCQIKPVYYKNLAKYKRILLQRNTLLKQENIDRDMLSIWDGELADAGARLILDRNDFIYKIDRISREIHSNITNGGEKLEIFYESDIPVQKDLSSQREVFIKKLESRYKNDIFRKTTTAGPHKDDLRIMGNGIDIRNFGSQGQQRTAALSLKLSEIRLILEETGETPILLLDDVLSELDLSRQKFLISSLGDVQLFITTAEMSGYLKETLSDNRIFKVDNGKISVEK